jgi:cytochrome d ubiquinol oxidase subunit I
MSTLMAVAVHLGQVDLPQQAPVHQLWQARVAIGVVASIHILLSALISGAGQLAPIIEWLGYVRQRRNYDRLAHGLGRFMVYYFSLSSTVAILFITVLLVGLWGHFWTTAVRLTWWPLFIEACTFVLQVTLTYTWYYSWESFRNFKGLHMALGGLLAIASFLQVYMINVLAGYMLTPVDPGNPIKVILNPSLYPLQLHRTVGNMAYIGFALAAFAALRFGRAHKPEDRAFYDWAGSFGLLWGLGLSLIQPIVGYSYAKEIQLHAYGSWYKMMLGQLSSVFVWQIFLFGVMLLVSVLYFTRRLRSAQAPGAGVMKVMAFGLVLSTLLAAMPYHLAFTFAEVSAAGRDRPFWQGGLINPLGAMIPWKVLALMAFTLLAVAALFFYLRGSRDIAWGKPGRVEQRLLISSAILTMAMIVTMGFIRENGRVPDLVTGRMTLQHQQEIIQPEVSPRVAP